MAEDTSKSAKIKLSLNDLAPKQPAPVSLEQSLQDLPPDKTANLRIKPPIEKPPITLSSQEQPKVGVVIPSPSSQEDRPKINLKKPNLQDIKLKVNLDKGDASPSVAPEALKSSSPVPAYMKSNVPNQDESNASSPSLKIEEDLKGKTQKIIESEPQAPRKSVIDLNSLKIDLNKNNSEEAIPPAAAPPMPNIDFEAHAPIPNKAISDTVKLKIKAQSGGAGVKPFGSLIKDSKETEAPPQMAKVKETVPPPQSFETKSPIPKLSPSQGMVSPYTKSEEDFVIPKDVSKTSSPGGKTKKKPNIIILGVMVVVLILIVYFMITTLKTLSS